MNWVEGNEILMMTLLFKFERKREKKEKGL
jgi:hypothetical protein